MSVSLRTPLREAVPAGVVGRRGRGGLVAAGSAVGGWPVWAAAVVVVLLRLPFLTVAPGPDEGGYLAVASQWRPGGSSLYGSYWVDRPPLLLTIFALADRAGGVSALRLLGCLATAVTVLAVGWCGQRAAGRRAAVVSALVAGLLLGTPLFGASWVNGELLAAPFTAAAFALAVAALDPAARTRARWCAVGVGAAGAAALLVKQNLADAVVFTAVVWLLAWRMRRLRGAELVRLVAASTVGVTVCAAVMAAWTLRHGTSVVGVYDAMYPFRLRASHVSAVLTSPSLQHRLDRLVLQWLVSAVPLLMVAFTVAVLGRRLRGPVAPALLATMVFGTASILAGGSYWPHYLVELVVPVALGTGLLATTRRRLTSSLVAVVAVLAAAAWGGVLVMRIVTPGAVVGSAIARSAHPRDTLVTVFGNANVVRTSGLRSPYPYLWALPARILDPRMRILDRVLSGSHHPTWVVAENRSVPAWLNRGVVGAVLQHDYRAVGRVCGKIVYLHDGQHRRPLVGTCTHSPSALARAVQDWNAATGTGGRA